LQFVLPDHGRIPGHSGPFIFRGYPAVAMPFSTDLAKHRLCSFEHRRFLGPYSGHSANILTSSEDILAVFPVRIHRNQCSPPAFNVVFKDLQIPDHLIIETVHYPLYTVDSPICDECRGMHNGATCPSAYRSQ
ncbi:MAG: hypothetical protein ACRCSI_04285, partial [Eubacterium aggregans]